MGLDAFVSCKCWEDGLCNPPPSLAPRLWYAPETAEVNQTTPDGLSLEEVLPLDLEFDKWVYDDACAHPRMRIADERISNWGGLGMFHYALRSLGEGSYSTLLREISKRGGGLTKLADARICLAELDCFRSTGPFGLLVKLVNGDTDEYIQFRIGYRDELLTIDGETRVSDRLDEGVFQIELGKAGLMPHDPDAIILFESKAFSQTRNPAGNFCFTDLLSGKQLLSQHGLQDASGRYPISLKVRQGSDNSARYAYCVEPLRRVFKAAIATGHPVLWS